MHTIYGQTTNFLAGYALKANLRQRWIKDDTGKTAQIVIEDILYPWYFCYDFTIIGIKMHQKVIDW